MIIQGHLPVLSVLLNAAHPFSRICQYFSSHSAVELSGAYSATKHSGLGRLVGERWSKNDVEYLSLICVHCH